MSETVFQRRVDCSPSYNKIDPNPSKNYGIAAVRIWFILIGPKGAIQWQIGTNWYCKAAQQHLDSLSRNLTDNMENILGGSKYQPQAWDIGYHSLKPMYDDQKPMKCNLIPGQPECYYDGSILRAMDFMDTFLEGGSDALWKALEKEYHSTFDEIE